jgi:multiple antibiotic resistance protein
VPRASRAKKPAIRLGREFPRSRGRRANRRAPRFSAKRFVTAQSLTDNLQRYIRGSIRITPLATIGVILSVVLPDASSAQTSGSFRSSISSAHVDLGETFTFLFLMLGPIKVLGPFVKMTERAEARFRRQLAIRAIIFSCLALAAAAVVGERALRDYGVSLNVLVLTGGLVLSVVAFQKILEQFRPVAIEETGAETLSLDSAAFRLAFPSVITPYGIAAVIIFIAIAQETPTEVAIFLLAVGVLLLDLVAMLIARPLLKWLGAPLLILDAVLAIIQLAFGVQIILTSLAAIGVFPLRAQ